MTAVDSAQIVIPVEMLPGDGRFGCGPSKVRAEQVDSLARVATTYLGTSHRQATVKGQVARIQEGLRDFFKLPDDYSVVVGNGGATAFWEVATFGLIRERAQFLSFGEFGSKFAKSASIAPFLGEQDVRLAPAGSAPVFEAADGIDVYASPHNETSTGVAIKPGRVAGSSDDSLMVFDATSGAGGLPVRAADFDVYYFSPQKSFGSDGGLWIALMSPLALERAREISASGRHIPAFLDLVTAIDNSVKNQTYNTPALATIWMMAEQVDWFNKSGGIDWAVARTQESASTLYSWAESNVWTTPFVADPELRSAVVGTIDIHERLDAAAVAKALRANGIVDTEPYRKLGRNQLRIAMFPSVEPADVAALTRCIDYLIARMAG
ncbi:MAG: phosphoserine transaminase [Candidatus Nanopelagicales bacterium]|nr:phosphoserine transaminase [Candidatus Nanopelagicales bacterium]